MERRSQAKAGKLNGNDGKEEVGDKCGGEWKETVCVVCFSPIKYFSPRHPPSKEDKTWKGNNSSWSWEKLNGEGQGINGAELLTILNAFTNNHSHEEAISDLAPNQEGLSLCGGCSVMVGRLDGMYRTLLQFQSHFHQLQQNIFHKIMTSSLEPSSSMFRNAVSCSSSWDTSPRSLSEEKRKWESSSGFRDTLLKQWRGRVASSDICQASSPASGSAEDTDSRERNDEEEEDAINVISPVTVKQEEVEFDVGGRGNQGDPLRSDTTEMIIPFQTYPHASEEEGKRTDGSQRDPDQAIHIDESDYFGVGMSESGDSAMRRVGEEGSGGPWGTCLQAVKVDDDDVEEDGRDQVYYPSTSQGHSHPGIYESGGGGGAKVGVASLSPDVTAYNSTPVPVEGGSSKRGMNSRTRSSKAIKTLNQDKGSEGSQSGLGRSVNFSCSVCAQNFPDREIFKEHLRSHSLAEKKYPTCLVCHQVFTRKNDLVLHMRTHTEKKEVVSRPIEAVLIPGSKKHAQVIAEGFVFNFNKSSTDNIYYTCTNIHKSQCKAKIIMRQGSTGTTFELRGVHNNHEPVQERQVILEL